MTLGRFQDWRGVAIVSEASGAFKLNPSFSPPSEMGRIKQDRVFTKISASQRRLRPMQWAENGC